MGWRGVIFALHCLGVVFLWTLSTSTAVAQKEREKVYPVTIARYYDGGSNVQYLRGMQEADSEPECTAIGYRFECEQTMEFENGAGGRVTEVTMRYNCATDGRNAGFGFDIRAGEDCTCEALAVDESSTRECSCGVCREGFGENLVSIDCGLNTDSPGFVGECQSLDCFFTCNGRCFTDCDASPDCDQCEGGGGGGGPPPGPGEGEWGLPGGGDGVPSDGGGGWGTTFEPTQSPATAVDDDGSSSGTADEADANCTAAFEATAMGVFLSDDCKPPEEEEGSEQLCPEDTCGALLGGLHSACRGKSYATTGDDGVTEVAEEYVPANLAAFSFLMDDACKDYPYEFLLAQEDVNSCEDWAPISIAAAFLSCGENCTDVCKKIIGRQYEVCAATDTVTIDGEESSIQELELGAAFLRSEECTEYADGLTFQGTGSNPADETDFPTPTVPNFDNNNTDAVQEDDDDYHPFNCEGVEGTETYECVFDHKIEGENDGEFRVGEVKLICPRNEEDEDEEFDFLSDSTGCSCQFSAAPSEDGTLDAMTCPCFACPWGFGSQPVSIDCSMNPVEMGSTLFGSCTNVDCNMECDGDCIMGCDLPETTCSLCSDDSSSEDDDDDFIGVPPPTGDPSPSLPQLPTFMPTPMFDAEDCRNFPRRNRFECVEEETFEDDTVGAISMKITLNCGRATEEETYDLGNAVDCRCNLEVTFENEIFGEDIKCPCGTCRNDFGDAGLSLDCADYSEHVFFSMGGDDVCPVMDCYNQCDGNCLVDCETSPDCEFCNGDGGGFEQPQSLAPTPAVSFAAPAPEAVNITECMDVTNFGEPQDPGLPTACPSMFEADACIVLSWSNATGQVVRQECSRTDPESASVNWVLESQYPGEDGLYIITYECTTGNSCNKPQPSRCGGDSSNADPPECCSSFCVFDPITGQEAVFDTSTGEYYLPGGNTAVTAAPTPPPPSISTSAPVPSNITECMEVPNTGESQDAGLPTTCRTSFEADACLVMSWSNSTGQVIFQGCSQTSEGAHVDWVLETAHPGEDGVYVITYECTTGDNCNEPQESRCAGVDPPDCCSTACAFDPITGEEGVMDPITGEYRLPGATPAPSSTTGGEPGEPSFLPTPGPAAAATIITECVTVSNTGEPQDPGLPAACPAVLEADACIVMSWSNSTGSVTYQGCSKVSEGTVSVNWVVESQFPGEDGLFVVMYECTTGDNCNEPQPSRCAGDDAPECCLLGCVFDPITGQEAVFDSRTGEYTLPDAGAGTPFPTPTLDPDATPSPSFSVPSTFMPTGPLDADCVNLPVGNRFECTMEETYEDALGVISMKMTINCGRTTDDETTFDILNAVDCFCDFAASFDNPDFGEDIACPCGVCPGDFGDSFFSVNCSAFSEHMFFRMSDDVCPVTDCYGECDGNCFVDCETSPDCEHCDADDNGGEDDEPGLPTEPPAAESVTECVTITNAGEPQDPGLPSPCPVTISEAGYACIVTSWSNLTNQVVQQGCTEVTEDTISVNWVLESQFDDGSNYMITYQCNTGDNCNEQPQPSRCVGVDNPPECCSTICVFDPVSGQEGVYDSATGEYRLPPEAVTPVPTPGPDDSTPIPTPGGPNDSTPVPTPTPGPNDSTPVPTPIPDPDSTPVPTPIPDPDSTPVPTPTPDPDSTPIPTPSVPTSSTMAPTVAEDCKNLPDNRFECIMEDQFQTENGLISMTMTMNCEGTTEKQIRRRGIKEAIDCSCNFEVSSDNPRFGDPIRCPCGVCEAGFGDTFFSLNCSEYSDHDFFSNGVCAVTDCYNQCNGNCLQDCDTSPECRQCEATEDDETEVQQPTPAPALLQPTLSPMPVEVIPVSVPPHLIIPDIPIACTTMGSRYNCSAQARFDGFADGDYFDLEVEVNCARDGDDFDFRQGKDCTCESVIIPSDSSAANKTCPCEICQSGFGSSPVTVDCSENEESPFIVDNCVHFDCNFECNGACLDDCSSAGSNCSLCSANDDANLTSEPGAAPVLSPDTDEGLPDEDEPSQLTNDTASTEFPTVVSGLMTPSPSPAGLGEPTLTSPPGADVSTQLPVSTGQSTTVEGVMTLFGAAGLLLNESASLWEAETAEYMMSWAEDNLDAEDLENVQISIELLSQSVLGDDGTLVAPASLGNNNDRARALQGSSIELLFLAHVHDGKATENTSNGVNSTAWVQDAFDTEEERAVYVEELSAVSDLPQLTELQAVNVNSVREVEDTTPGTGSDADAGEGGNPDGGDTGDVGEGGGTDAGENQPREQADSSDAPGNSPVFFWILPLCLWYWLYEEFI